MVKRRLIAFCALMAFVTLIPLAGVPVSVSIGTWQAVESFGPSAGVHGMVGATVAVAPWLEVETSAIVQFTPVVGGSLMGSLALNIPLASALYDDEDSAMLYYNAMASVGALGGWDRLHDRPVGAVFIRLTPLMLGGPYYRARERSAALGVLYDLFDHSFKVFWNLLAFDRYL